MFSIDQIYRIYRGVSDQMEHSTLSQRRVHDILEELAFYEIIRTQKDSGDWQRGQVAMHRLVYTPSVVEEVVCGNYPPIADASDQITNNIFDYLHE